MGIVGYGRCHCTVSDAVALCHCNADFSGIMMPLHSRNLGIAVRRNIICRRLQGNRQILCGNLGRIDADYMGFLFSNRKHKLLCLHLVEVHRMFQRSAARFYTDRRIPVYKLSFIEHICHIQILQIIQHNKVRLEARRNRAQML